MRKFEVVWSTGFVLGMFLSLCGCSRRSDVENTDWFKCAQKYDKAYSKMLMEMDRETLEKDLMDEVSKLREKFLQSRQPEQSEIVSVLRSPSRKLQRIGLAAMSLRLAQTDEVVEILFEFLQGQNREFRWYAVHALGELRPLEEAKRASWGRQLLEITRRERDVQIQMKEIFLLGELGCEEAIPFLTEQLMKEGEEYFGLRVVAYLSLWKMGGPFYDKVANYSSAEIRKAVEDLENRLGKKEKQLEKE